MVKVIAICALIAGLAVWAPNIAAQQNISTSSPETSVIQKLSTPQTDSGDPVLSQRNPRYRVQRDDVLSLSFPIAPEFNQKVTIQPDGYITLQGIGSLHVEGMTVPEVTEALRVSYSKILHDPVINVDLTDFQKPFFVVSGQVAKPGQYDLRYDTTISEAIAIAGGCVPTAKTQVYLYHRVSPGLVQVRRINLKAIMNGKKIDEDAEMRPGDMVFVPEKFIVNFRKYVPYSFGMYTNPTSVF